MDSAAEHAVANNAEGFSGLSTSSGGCAVKHYLYVYLEIGISPGSRAGSGISKALGRTPPIGRTELIGFGHLAPPPSMFSAAKHAVANNAEGFSGLSTSSRGRAVKHYLFVYLEIGIHQLVEQTWAGFGHLAP